MDAEWTEKEVRVSNVWEGAIEDATLSTVFYVVFQDEEGEEMRLFVLREMAYAISLALEKEVPERPFTHDLMMTVLNHTGISIRRVTICDLREDTFYATMTLVQGEETYELDARPSDAVALALRCNAPIYVTRQVWDSARKTSDQQET